MDHAGSTKQLTILMRRFLFFILLCFTPMFFAGCYYDHFDELHPLSALTDVCDSSYAATYGQSVNVIMQNNCISCHSSSLASGGITLDNYSAVVAQAKNGSLMGSIQQHGGYEAMPPGTQIRSCEITKLQQWINAGLPQ